MDVAVPPSAREIRWSAGKTMRGQVPLEAHAEVVRSGGTDPVALLDGQSSTRVAELVPVRYGRMLVSPFSFYRGPAVIMAEDLAAGPRTELTTQLCGDAHLSNFGVFASPERRLVFDVNDFDESHPGHFEWDGKRLAASLEVAGRAEPARSQATPHDRAVRSAHVPQHHARARGDDEPGGLVRAPGRPAGAAWASRHPIEGDPALRPQEPRQSLRPRPPRLVEEPDRDRGRSASDSRATRRWWSRPAISTNPLG